MMVKDNGVEWLSDGSDSATGAISSRFSYSGREFWFRFRSLARRVSGRCYLHRV
jgi:hypothetical protein